MNNCFIYTRQTIGACILLLNTAFCLAQPTFKQIGATAPLASNTHDFNSEFDSDPVSADFNNDSDLDMIYSGDGYISETDDSGAENFIQ